MWQWIPIMEFDGECTKAFGCLVLWLWMGLTSLVSCFYHLSIISLEYFLCKDAEIVWDWLVITEPVSLQELITDISRSWHMNNRMENLPKTKYISSIRYLLLQSQPYQGHILQFCLNLICFWLSLPFIQYVHFLLLLLL